MDEILLLAEKCLLRSKNERPELSWLKEKLERLRLKYNIRKKGELDAFIFRKMYDKEPDKHSDLLKIRYWRTGLHLPGNRQQYVLLGKALELSDDEMAYLIQAYADRSLDLYPSVPDSQDSMYARKINELHRLAASYLTYYTNRQLDEYKISLDKAKSYLRHIYYTDALQYIYLKPESMLPPVLQHITSIHYDSELARQLKLIGEIPRKTMIRHLLILGLPHITLEKLNEQLCLFGYLPLTREHTLSSGEALDWLLIELMHRYQTVYQTTDPQQALLWFKEACRVLDYYFLTHNKPKLRFMHFKALDL